MRARDDFRYGVLEALTLFLLTARDRIPFHAAAIARGDTALLVSGPSGAGKSTFTWAALRARTGWRLLSEDCVYLQCTGESRVWGWPGYLHLGEGATRFFPELSDRDTVIRASGREKLAVAADASACLRSWRGQATLCLLERSTSGPAIEPLPLRAALARVTGRLEPGFDRFGASLPQALARTLAPDAWRVDAGTDPNRVPALLERLARATSEVR